MNIYVVVDQDNSKSLTAYKTKNEASNHLGVHRNTLNIDDNEYKIIKGYAVHKRVI